MNPFRAILTLLAALSFISAAAQTENFYAKNSGEWNSVDNWTEDASGSVYTNSRSVIPGITAGFTGTGVDVKIHSNKLITATIPAIAATATAKDYVDINNLALYGQLNINSLSPLHSDRFRVRRITGTGKLLVNTTDVFDRLEVPAMLQDFNGEIITDNAAITTFVFANLNPGATVTEMPKSTVRNGTATLVSNYKIKGDLTIEEGGTIYIAPGITLEVEGNVIVKGHLYDGAAEGIASRLAGLGITLGTTPARLKVGGSFINTGEVDFTKGKGVIVEFPGDNEATLELNNTKANNKFYQIVCNKTGNGKVSIFNNGGNADALTLSQTGIAGNVDAQPLVVNSGALSLGYGVTLASGNYWSSRTEKYTTQPSAADDAGRAGNLYIPEGAHLSIDGAKVTVGPNSAVFIAGEFDVNSGTFTSGTPGILFVNTTGSSIRVLSKMVVNGGTLNATRIASLDECPAVFAQNGGTMNMSGTADVWGDNTVDTNTSIKTLYLADGSQLILKGGVANVNTNATGSNTPGVFHLKFGNLTGVSTTGGTVRIGGNAKILAGFTGCYNLEVTSGATLTMLSPSDITIANNMTVAGTFISDRDLKIGGNFKVTGTYNTNSGAYNINGGAPSLTVYGKKHSTYSTSSTITWKNLTIEKDKGYRMTANSPIRVSGDVTSESGAVDGKVVLCGGKQTLTEYSAGLASVDIEAAANTTNAIYLGSDVELRNFHFAGQRVVELSTYNLKIQNYPTAINNAFGLNTSFRVPATNTASAAGLSLPVPDVVNEDNTVIFPMSVDGKYTWMNARYTYLNIGDSKYGESYITMVPVNKKHPALNGEEGIDFYWIISCSKDFTCPSGSTFWFYRTNYPGSSMSFGNNKTRQVMFTKDGWKRGDDVNKNTSKWNNQIDFGNANSGSMFFLSGHFTVANSTDMNNDFYYESAGTGKWDDGIWDRRKVGDAVVQSRGHKGSTIGASSVIIRSGHTVTYDNTTTNIEYLTIESGATLIINESQAANFKAIAIKGSGTLQYNLNSNATFTIANADHKEFFNDPDATVILNYPSTGTTKTWYLRACSAFPNTIVQAPAGSGSVLKLADAPDLLVRGSLTVKGGITFNLDKTDGADTRAVVVVSDDLTVGTGSTLALSNSSESHSELAVYGNTTNAGTISGGVAPVYFWGNLINTGTVQITSDLVHFYGPNAATISSSDACGTVTRLGKSVIINKETPNVKVDFKTRVWTGDNDDNKEFNVDIQRGILSFSHSCEQILTQYYPTDPAGEGNFNVVSDGSLALSNGCKAVIRVNDFSMMSPASLLLGSSLSISGNATTLAVMSGANYRGMLYSTNSTLSVSGSTLNLRCITPTESGSSLNLTLNKATVNCQKGSATQTLDNIFGIFDIRNGSAKITSSTVNINDVPMRSSSVPALYYYPQSSSVDAASKFVVNYDGSNPFLIQAHEAIGSLVVNSTATKLYGDDLVLNGDLIINDGKSLTANNKNVTIKRNLTIGTGSSYACGTNTTTFSGAGTAQTISVATADTELHNVVINSTAGISTSGKNIIVNNNFSINNGTLNVAGTKAIRILGDVSIAESGAVAGLGLIVGNGDSSAETNELFCEGSISKLEIDNTLGVDMAKAQAKPLTITSDLKLTRGVFDVISNLVEIGADATISNGNDAIPFGKTKMIATNGSYTDNGLKVYFKSGVARSFEIPLGKKNKVYAPVVLDGMNSSTGGTMTFSSNDEVHYKVKEGIDKAAAPKPTALNYYWNVTASSGFTTTAGEVKFRYPKSDITDNSEGWVSRQLDLSTLGWVAGKSIDLTTIELVFDAVNKSTYNGVYTAYHGSLVLDGIPVYVAETSGAWTDAIWRKYNKLENYVIKEPAASLSTFEEGAVAMIGVMGLSGAGIADKSDVVVTMNEGNHLATFVQICATSTLNVKKTLNNNFFNVYGRGTLKVEGPSALPSAKYDSFFIKDGGTIEYGGDESYIVFDELTANNVIFSGTGTRNLRSNYAMKALGNVTINGSDVHFNGKDLAVEGDLTINGGSVSGTGNFVLNGSTGDQTISSTNGVTEATLSGLTINKASGKVTSSLNRLNLKKLTLTKGVLESGDKEISITSGGSVSGGNDNSYVDGVLCQSPVRTDIQTIFPLGDGTVYARTPLIASTTGEWKIRYFLGNPKALSSKPDGVSLGGEYWKVLAPSNGAQAKLGMRWDENAGGQFDVNEGDVVSLVEPVSKNEWIKVNSSDVTGSPAAGTLITDDVSFNAIMDSYDVLKETKTIDGLSMKIKAGKTATILSVPITLNSDEYAIMIYDITTNGDNCTTSPASGTKYESSQTVSINVNNTSWLDRTFRISDVTLKIYKKVTDSYSAYSYFAFRGYTTDTEFEWTGAVSTDWNDVDNWSLGRVPNSTSIVKIPLVVNKPSIGDGVAASVKDITIANSSFVTLSGNGSFAVTGDIVNNGNIYLNYAYNANPNFYYRGNLTGNKFVVNREFETQRLYYIGSATDERTFADYDNDGVYDDFVNGDAYAFCSAGQRTFQAEASYGAPMSGSYRRQNLTGADDKLRNIAKSAGVIGLIGDANTPTRSLTQIGTVAKDNVSCTVELPADDNQYGFTWLAQPYPFNLDITGIGLGSNAHRSIYVHQNAADYADNYATYNADTKICLNEDIRVLAPFQAFAVGNESTTSKATITFSPKKASSSSSLKSLVFDNEEQTDFLRLSVSNGSKVTDEMALVFREGGTDYLTESDSKKMLNSGGTSLNIFTVKDEQPVAVALFPDLTDMEASVEIPLVLSGDLENAVIRATNIIEFGFARNVYLLDSRTGVKTNLRYYPVVAVVNPETLNADTYKLVFESIEEETPTDVEHVAAQNNNIKVTANEDVITVNIYGEIQNNASIATYDILGRIVKRVNVNGNTTKFYVAPSGVYVVEVVNGDSRSCKKVVLK